MKRFLKFSNREKIVVYFLAILILLNITTLVYTHNLRAVSDDFKSMLDDRLVPSADISKIQEGFYKNRLNIEELIFKFDSSNQNINARIFRNKQIIDSVLQKYSKTKLTRKEASELATLKKRIKDYRHIESEIQNYFYEGEVEVAKRLFRKDGLQQFQLLTEELHKLADLQIEVGSNLYKDAKDKLGTINLVSYLSIGVAIFVAVNMFKVLGIKFN